MRVADTSIDKPFQNAAPISYFMWEVQSAHIFPGYVTLGRTLIGRIGKG